MNPLRAEVYSYATANGDIKIVIAMEKEIK